MGVFLRRVKGDGVSRSVCFGMLQEVWVPPYLQGEEYRKEIFSRCENESRFRLMGRGATKEKNLKYPWIKRTGGKKKKGSFRKKPPRKKVQGKKNKTNRRVREEDASRSRLCPRPRRKAG